MWVWFLALMLGASQLPISLVTIYPMVSSDFPATGTQMVHIERSVGTHACLKINVGFYRIKEMIL